MESSLDSVLSEEAADTQVTDTPQVEQATQELSDAGEQATGDTTGTPPEENKDDPLEKHRKGLEAAAAAERRKRQEAEQRAQQAEAQLRALQQPKQQQQQTQNGDGKPLRSQFATEDEWLDARDAWRDGQREAARVERETKDREAAIQRSLDDTVDKGRKQFADFDAVINGNLAPFITPQLQLSLSLADRGHEVAYWLGKNPADAQRVAALPPLLMARELALIEATKLNAAATQEERLQLPETLTQARDARGRFDKTPAYDGPTPLDDVLKSK